MTLAPCGASNSLAPKQVICRTCPITLECLDANTVRFSTCANFIRTPVWRHLRPQLHAIYPEYSDNTLRPNGLKY